MHGNHLGLRVPGWLQLFTTEQTATMSRVWRIPIDRLILLLLLFSEKISGVRPRTKIPLGVVKKTPSSMMFWLRQNGSATADNDGCSSGTVLAITNLTLTWLSSFRLIRRYDMFARTHTRTYTRTHTRVCAHVRMNARTHSSLFKNFFWLKIRGWRTSFKFITTFCYCS